MKTLVKFIYFILIVGIILVIAGVASGATIDSVRDALTDSAIYVAYDESVEETFESIYIKTDNKNVDIKVSDEVDKPQLKYHLKETEEMSITITDSGQLSIELEIEQHFFNWFSFGWTPSGVNTLYVTLPSTYQGKLQINTSAGNVTVDGVFNDTILDTQFGNVYVKGEYKSLDIGVSAGNVRISNTKVSSNVVVKGQSGNVNVENSEVSGTINLSVSAGNVNVKHVDAISYTLKSSAGNVTLNLNMSTSAYAFKLSTNAGNVRMNGTKVSRDYQVGSGILVDAKTSAGNINIHTK